VTESDTRLFRRIEELAALADDDDGHSTELAELRHAVSATHTGLASVRSDLAALRDAIAALGRAIPGPDAVKAAIGEPIGSVRDALEERLAVIEDGVAGLSDQLEVLARDSAAATTSSVREHLAGEIDSLRGDLADALEEVGGRVITTGADHAATLRGELATQGTAIGKAVKDATVPLDALAKTQATHTEAQAKHTEVQAKHTEAQARHTEAQAKHTEAQAKHTEVQAHRHARRARGVDRRGAQRPRLDPRRLVRSHRGRGRASAGSRRGGRRRARRFRAGDRHEPAG
jgi:chromosome segregation ATPase